MKGAYPALEARIPERIDGSEAASRDSGRFCSKETLGSVLDAGVTEVRFGGAIWEVGERGGIQLGAFEGDGLTPALLAEEYRRAADASRRTEAVRATTLEVEGRPAWRIDVVNGSSRQAIVVWGSADGGRGPGRRGRGRGRGAAPGCDRRLPLSDQGATRAVARMGRYHACHVLRCPFVSRGRTGRLAPVRGSPRRSRRPFRHAGRRGPRVVGPRAPQPPRRLPVPFPRRRPGARRRRTEPGPRGDGRRLEGPRRRRQRRALGDLASARPPRRCVGARRRSRASCAAT